ncbi:hypothetical protein GHT06_018403 [Daphnia sinensis]|uniref:Transposable element P transposase-like GTP-binding insertion domain-containing protein n=1 Tax=Daphnia sinensis TaxID=1820382 RepID=A0AAD5PQ48_9CRUS|nr:hypothetical protein GHT06_018403 [Daphnia sinensis]
MIDRPLKWNGELIDFSLIKLLFAKTISDGLSLCQYLTRKHVDPTNFERMKVAYARDIFRPAMVAALRGMHDLKEVGFQKVEPLVNFLEFFLEILQLPRCLQPDSALKAEGSFILCLFDAVRFRLKICGFCRWMLFEKSEAVVQSPFHNVLLTTDRFFFEENSNRVYTLFK